MRDIPSAHEAARGVAALASAGASACHPPPSPPDPDPIEPTWSKVEGIARALEARAAEAPLDAIGVAPRSVTATDAEGWFARRGHGDTDE